jgi:hypothetical protein
VKFENQGYVDLRSINGKIKYLGKEIEIQNIDGSTMLIESRQKRDEFEVCRARYFGGGSLRKLKRCYVASRGDFYAHGETLKEAIEDVNFKYLQESQDISEVIERVRETQMVNLTDYRLITGACRLGCKEFLKDKGLLDKTELPLNQVLELTANAYGGGRMAELFSNERG